MKLGTELKDENLISEIERTWGSLENFKKDFMDISMSVFGSGWVYLVKRPNGELKFIKLFNQDNPWFLKFTPLFAVDLWEHSYYLEYKWDRARYLEEFWKVINWDFVSEEYNK
jgi:Fe-Mn family superoxide dismutase